MTKKNQNHENHENPESELFARIAENEHFVRKAVQAFFSYSTQDKTSGKLIFRVVANRGPRLARQIMVDAYMRLAQDIERRTVVSLVAGTSILEHGGTEGVEFSYMTLVLSEFALEVQDVMQRRTKLFEMLDWEAVAERFFQESKKLLEVADRLPEFLNSGQEVPINKTPAAVFLRVCLQYTAEDYNIEIKADDMSKPVEIDISDETLKKFFN